ncbi:MAG: pyridoxal-phosphate dependent enzyme, partial [bacterium]|nr:pyridoxal-phosphate dependent enzyme [bacterium]
GIAFPYVPEVMAGENIRLIGVEPEACPTLTRGQYRYDYGDSAKLTPLMPMYTLGHSFVPPGIHAGGLRYHGDSQLLSFLVKNNIIEAQAYHQNAVFEAAILFAKTEGIVCAPEAAHAVKSAIEEAKKAKDEAKEKVILFNLSGHGFFDLASYDVYLNGKLEDYEYPEQKIKEAISELPEIK